MKLVLIVAISTIFALSSADLRSESLAANNKYRAQVGVSNLVWSDSLAQSAQAWADNLASSGRISHSKNRVNTGENLAYGTANTNDIETFVDLWGAEGDYFVAGRNYPECTSGSESDVWHYTQMIWQKTTELGCGMGTNAGRLYYVCHYHPQGNMLGQPVYTTSGSGSSSSAAAEYPSTQQQQQPQQTQWQPQTSTSQYEPEYQSGSQYPYSQQPQQSTNSYSQQPQQPQQPTTSYSGQPQQSNPNANTNSYSQQPQQSSTPASASSSSYSQQDSFISESLAAHHYWRSAVGVPDLVWNTTLAASAQAWADNLASTGKISHSKNRVNTGENLSYGTANTNDVTSFVGLWGAESEYYVAGPNYPQCTSGSESDVWHYTQLIWRRTTQLGCGMGSSSGRLYYVCQYYPRGNMLGQPVM